MNKNNLKKSNLKQWCSFLPWDAKLLYFNVYMLSFFSTINSNFTRIISYLIVLFFLFQEGCIISYYSKRLFACLLYLFSSFWKDMSCTELKLLQIIATWRISCFLYPFEEHYLSLLFIHLPSFKKVIFFVYNWINPAYIYWVAIICKSTLYAKPSRFGLCPHILDSSPEETGHYKKKHTSKCGKYYESSSKRV